jgi:putative acetyltransferase
VLPHHQGVGVGHALMHAVLAAAEAVDETVVGVLGDPAYYARFGFRPASAVRIAADSLTVTENRTSCARQADTNARE